MLRAIGFTVLGLLAGFAVTTAGDAVGMIAHPPPEGFDPADRAALAAHAAAAPVWVLGAMAASWGVGACLAGLIALGFGRTPVGAGVAVLLYAAAVGANLYLIPHPAWMTYAGAGAAALGSLVGLRLGRLIARRRPPAAA